MRAIQKELGEGGEEEEIGELKGKLKKAKLPKEIYDKVAKELSRLAKLSVHNPETSYLRTWVETILELPWGEYTKSSYSLSKAEKILNQDHYGLEKVKERILEYIAVLKLKSEQVKKTKKQAPVLQPSSALSGLQGQQDLGWAFNRQSHRPEDQDVTRWVKDEAEIVALPYIRRSYAGEDYSVYQR
jgi:ATP-dependent Lon protease